MVAASPLTSLGYFTKTSVLEIFFQKWHMAHALPKVTSLLWFLKRVTHIQTSNLPSLEYKLGNGRIIPFWHDRQYAQVPLKNLFPATFNLSLNKDALVYSQCERARWRLNLSQPLLVSEETQIRDLKSLLCEITPSEINEDQPIWKWNKNGAFFVRSTYHHFMDSGINSINTKWIWNINPPLKSGCSFGWFTIILSSYGQHYKDRVGQAQNFVSCVARMENILAI